MERRRNGSAVWVVGWLNTAKTGKFMKTTDMYFGTFRKSHLFSGKTTVFKKWELPVSRETPNEVKFLSKRLE